MNEPKFIQIISHDGTLYALDESGQIWWFNFGSGVRDGGWTKWYSRTDK